MVRWELMGTVAVLRVSLGSSRTLPIRALLREVRSSPHAGRALVSAKVRGGVVTREIRTVDLIALLERAAGDRDDCRLASRLARR